MAPSNTAPVQVEGVLNGMPALLHYQPEDASNNVEGALSYLEVYPESDWTRIDAKDILLCAKELVDDPEYHLCYVAKNPAAEQDSKASPVVFKSITVKNPPKRFDLDHAGLALEADVWKYRQDLSTVQPNCHVIVSTGSGTGLAADVWKQLVRPAFHYLNIQGGKHYQLHFTESENSISDFVRDVLLPRANNGVGQSVVLLSGDGGVVDLVNSLFAKPRTSKYKKPNISLFPVGTGNALAHAADLTQDNTLGLKAWMRGGLQELPLFCASFSQGARVLFDEARQERPLRLVNGIPTAHGSVVASWGLHAGLVADSDTTEYRKFGVERFKMAANEALHPSDGSLPHVYRADVLIQRPGDDRWHQIRDGEHAYVLATLVSQLEKGFTISPASKQLDGKLRLVHFGPMSGDAAMEVMGKAYNGGQHVDDERVGYEEIEALRIHFREEDARWRRVCIDGTIIRVEKDGFVGVRAGQKGVVDLVL